MKLNAKDFASGIFLILFAAIGLWLNMDHALGSARRMGPGYMPMLVFWIQIGLGAIVLLTSLRSGPDPLERWTGLDWGGLVASLVVGTIVAWICMRVGGFFGATYNAIGFGMLAGFLVICVAEGWRLMGFVCASMCVFAILLEQGGLVAATIGTVCVSALADPDHRKHPLGVAGMTVFLVALCWLIFIRELDIRVAVWPQFGQ